MFDYHLGPRGIEPKLKFKVRPIAGSTPANFSLEQLIDRIILGPSAASLLARDAVCRMLEKIGKPQLADRVVMSGIPYRPR